MKIREDKAGLVEFIAAMSVGVLCCVTAAACTDVDHRDEDEYRSSSSNPDGSGSSSSSDGGSSTTDGGGGGSTDSVGEDDPDQPTPGIQYDAARPNIMLLVDRSGSMAEPADCGEASCPSKWEQLVGLGVYLEEVQRSANLGLALFPSPEEHGCSVRPSLMVPLSEEPGTDQEVFNVLLTTQPGGRTPVAAALDEIGRIGDLDDPDRDNILVVLTDGQPNCSCPSGNATCEREEAVAAVERLVHRDPTVKVYIMGFGSSARDAHETLTEMARVDRGHDYYQADTIEELIGLLYEVAIENVPCRFYLDIWPEPEDLVVWMDDEQVEPCQAERCDEGYTYDPTDGVVDFHGATCEALRDGERHSVWFDELTEEE